MRPAPDAPGPRTIGLGDFGRLAFRQMRTMATDYALLAVLDARSAAIRLAWLLSAGLVVAVLVVSAWLALVAGGLVWLLGTGFGWPAALGLAAGVNVIGAIALVLWMRGVFTDLPFAATLRQLKGEAPEARGESV